MARDEYDVWNLSFQKGWKLFRFSADQKVVVWDPETEFLAITSIHLVNQVSDRPRDGLAQRASP